MSHLRLILNTATPEWHEQANCQGTDGEEFFPDKGGSTRQAKRVCARCPVQTECLEWALATNQPYGVWGGLSERERRALKRRATAGAEAVAA